MAQANEQSGRASPHFCYRPHGLETLQNIETVKSISGSEKLRTRWLNAVDEQADVNVKTKFYNQIATSFSSTALMFNQIIIVSYGVILIGSGDLSMGGLIDA